jgi:hypothetical protein
MTNLSTSSNAPVMLSSLKGFAVALLVFASTASWADNNAHATKSTELVKAAAVGRAIPTTTSLTTFVDGPTGFVFVYTVEGWKFVGATKN